MLRAFGAEVIVCPTNVAPTDRRSYYSVAERLSKESPNSFYPNQYDHPANAEAHYQTTGPELWEQTEGRITHFVAGAGTGGTISGTARYLKEQNPDVQVIGVDPYGSVYAEYWRTGEFKESEIYPYATEGVGEDILAKNMDFSLVDDYVQVDDKTTMQMTRRLAREEGLFIGQSCGMAMAGALDWMDANRDRLTEDDVVVVMLPDSGFRYLSKTYDDEWMRRNGFLETTPSLTVHDVLAVRPRHEAVIGVTPDDTLAAAIETMTAHGISQVPVLENGEVVGSLNERGVLNRLIEAPDARDEAVREVMGAPLPIVEAGVHLDDLTATLDGEAGAVLVRADGDDPTAFDILTRSDLISALARAGRQRG